MEITQRVYLEGKVEHLLTTPYIDCHPEVYVTFIGDGFYSVLASAELLMIRNQQTRVAEVIK